MDQSASDQSVPAIAITQPLQRDPYHQFSITSSSDLLHLIYELTQDQGKQANLSLDIVQLINPTDIGQVVYHHDRLNQASNGQIDWNGKNLSQSDFVEDGDYRLILTARDTDHIGLDQKQVDMALLRTYDLPIDIKQLQANPEQVPVGTETTITYTVSKEANVTVTIMDHNEQVLETLVDHEIKAPLTAYQVNYTPVAEGLFTCRMNVTAIDDSTEAMAAVPIAVGPNSGTGIAQIIAPENDEIVKGQTVLDWSATARGDYYPKQDFTADIKVNGIEYYYAAPPQSFNWKIKAKANRSISKSNLGKTRTEKVGDKVKMTINGNLRFDVDVYKCYMTYYFPIAFDFLPTVHSYSSNGFGAKTDWHYEEMKNYCKLESIDKFKLVLQTFSLFVHHNEGWITPEHPVFAFSVSGQTTVNVEGSTSSTPGVSNTIPFTISIPTGEGSISNHMLIQPIPNPTDTNYTYFPYSSDYDDQQIVSTKLGTYSRNGNVLTGKLEVTNNSRPEPRPWSTNFTIDSSQVSHWTTAPSYCYYNHPLTSKPLENNFYTTIAGQAGFEFANTKYTINSNSNPNVQIAFDLQSDTLKASTAVIQYGWTTGDDQGLSSQNSAIGQKNLVFNGSDDHLVFKTMTEPMIYSAFYPDVNMSAFHDIKDRYTFWKAAGQQAVDNPFVGIDADSSTIAAWTVLLDYPNRPPTDNAFGHDFAVDYRLTKPDNQDHHSATGHPIDINDSFSIKLTKGTTPQRYLAITGRTSAAGQGFKSYALYHQKSGSAVWRPIPAATTQAVTNGTLAYWDVTHLQGDHTVRLIVHDDSGLTEVHKNITIGTQSATAAAGDTIITAACNKAYLRIPAGSLAYTADNPIDPVISIAALDPKSEAITYETDMPMPIGSIYKLQPEGLQFDLDNPAWLSVRFLPEEMEGIDPGLLKAYYLKEDGTLESLDIPDPVQELSNDSQPVPITRVDFPVTHFSKYMVLSNIPAPVLDKTIPITDQLATPIYGQAEANTSVDIYVNDALSATTTADEQGRFSVDTPLIDGKNVITATASKIMAKAKLTSSFSTAKVILVDRFSADIATQAVIDNFDNDRSPDDDPNAADSQIWEMMPNVYRALPKSDLSGNTTTAMKIAFTKTEESKWAFLCLGDLTNEDNVSYFGLDKTLTMHVRGKVDLLLKLKDVISNESNDSPVFHIDSPDAWQVITWDYSQAGYVDLNRIKEIMLCAAPGEAGQGAFYLDNIKLGEPAPIAPYTPPVTEPSNAVIDNFENDQSQNDQAGAPDSQLWSPYKDDVEFYIGQGLGHNDTSSLEVTYVKTTATTEAWIALGDLNLEDNIHDFSGDQKLAMHVLGHVKLQLMLQDSDNIATEKSPVFDFTIGSSWQTLEWDISQLDWQGAEAQQVRDLVIFMDPGKKTQGSFRIDNIKLGEPEAVDYSGNNNPTIDYFDNDNSITNQPSVHDAGWFAAGQDVYTMSIDSALAGNNSAVLKLVYNKQAGNEWAYVSAGLSPEMGDRTDFSSERKFSVQVLGDVTLKFKFKDTNGNESGEIDLVSPSDEYWTNLV